MINKYEEPALKIENTFIRRWFAKSREGCLQKSLSVV